jgi:hypothetical protein
MCSRSTATERNRMLQLACHFNPIPDTHIQTAASYMLYGYANDLAFLIFRVASGSTATTHLIQLHCILVCCKLLQAEMAQLV